MADNLLLALAGAFKGAQDILVPYFKAEHENTLAKELHGAKQQMDSTPINTAEELSGQPTNLPRSTMIKPNELQLMKPTSIWDPTSQSTVFAGRGNVKSLPYAPNPKEPKKYQKIITSKQAQDLRDAGVNVNNEEYVIHDASAGEKKVEDQNKDANWAISEINRIMPLNEKASGGYLGALRQKGMSAMNKEDATFRNTADVVNSAQGLVTKVLKSTFGGQLSDSEREYMNQIYGAMPNYSIAERRIALTNVKRMLENKIGSDVGTQGKKKSLNDIFGQ